MTIQTDTNEPKELTKVAPAAEVKPAVPSESEKPAAEAKAPAENESVESEPTEHEEVEGSEAEVEESEAVEGEGPLDPASKEPNKKKGGFQRRIDKLNARVSAKEQELEYWKQQALSGAPASKTETKVEPAKTVAGDGKPKAESFETHAEYVEALTDWKTDQKFKEHSQKLEQSKLQTEQSKQVQSYQEKVKEFSSKTKDFDEVLGDVDDIPVSPAIREIIITSENGPELAYELAKNREEFARVCKLPPIAAAREMGKLEARLSLKSSPENKQEQKTTKAPAPLAPVRGGGTSSVPKTLEEAANTSFAAYKKQREAELKKRRQA